MKFLTLASSALALAFGSVAAEQYPNFEVASFSFSDVAIHNENTVEELKGALYSSGIVAVTGIDGFEDVQKAALSSFQSCVAKEHETMAKYELYDGTSRTSLGVEVMGSDALPFEVPESCSSFADASRALQSEVSRISDSFFSSLDAVLGSKQVISRVGKTDLKYASISHALMNANHLEHFHAYTSSSQRSIGRSVELHTDTGLLIAFTPGLFFDHGKISGDNEDDMFYIKLSNGKTVRAVLPPNSLVFMVGEAMQKLVDSNLYPVPHFLKVNPRHEQRMWFGRMFMPPADAVLTDKMSYGKYRQLIESGEATSEMRSIGCSGTLEVGSVQHGRTLNGDSDPNCTLANQAACWMQCREAPDCSGDYELRCTNDAGQIWVPGSAGGEACVAPDCVNGTALGDSSNRCCLASNTATCIEPDNSVDPSNGAEHVHLSFSAFFLLLSIVATVF